MFLNNYTPDPVEYDTATAGFNKVIKGADWIESDEFTFDLAKVSFNGETTDEALAKMPLADGANPAKVKSSTAKENDPVAFNFGKFTFTEAGTYVYKVTERSGAGGFVYDTHEATLTIDVVDNSEGKLIAAATVSGATFTNTYTNDLNYSAVGDMEINKILRGHDMLKDQFTFEFWTEDDASAEKFALKKNTITTLAAKDGQVATMSGVFKELRGGEDLIFTRAEVDNTYTILIKEKNDSAAGYEYDSRIWKVRIEIEYEDDKVKARTTSFSNKGDTTTWVYISGEQATSSVSAGFLNKYSATGSTAIAAKKEITGRPLSADEFEFSLHYADGTPVSGQIVKNDANGNVDFGTLNYDIKTLDNLVNNQRATYTVDDKGNKTWTIKYIAEEDTSSLPGGVSATKDSVPFIVTAVDNGDGTLKVTADTGTGGIVFKNVYSTGDPVPMELNGTKVLEHDDGLEPADITGKFKFTITSDDKNAPMPKDAQGNPLTQVTNDK
ncbi:MAG: FctA domain-containing protein, partial [Phoenicibacter congonensis]|nr:FctA domain-containing protein [Phoenicibacter congonensis]